MNNKREPKFKKKKSLEEDGKDFAYDVRPKLVQPNNRGVKILLLNQTFCIL